MLRKVTALYMGLSKPTSDSGDSGDTSEVTKEEFVALSSQVTQNENDIATLQNDRDDLGDQVHVLQADVGVLKQTSAKTSDLPTKTSDLTNDSGFITLSEVPEYTAGTGIDISDSKVISYTGKNVVTNEKYGIRADYALLYGITDCPNGIISYNSTDKELTIHQGVKLSMPNKPGLITFGNDAKYEIEETGEIVLFYTQTESSTGTIQQGFLEAGTVHYGEDEPVDGVTSYLAWWQPSKHKWQFKSVYTGNVWREADAQPIAKVRASNSIITSVSYIGYRVINDDIFAQLEDIENIETQISDILTRLDALEGK